MKTTQIEGITLEIERYRGVTAYTGRHSGLGIEVKIGRKWGAFSLHTPRTDAGPGRSIHVWHLAKEDAVTEAVLLALDIAEQGLDRSRTFGSLESLVAWVNEENAALA